MGLLPIVSFNICFCYSWEVTVLHNLFHILIDLSNLEQLCHTQTWQDIKDHKQVTRDLCSKLL